MLNDITIIIATRANIEYLEACIQSIRNKPQYDAIKILIGADNPSQEIKEWLSNNQKGQFDYVISEDKPYGNRMGIVRMYELLISKVTTKFIYILHDDMVVGDHTIENLIKQWAPKKILSSYRIEPPLYSQTPEKLILDLGFTPKEFKNEQFLEAEKQLIKQNNGKTVEGFFAPHFFAKDDWVTYDPLFEPQSREDSDQALQLIESGCYLFTVWDSVVYHFSGKGSRKKNGTEDNQEWKQSNYKNTRNYIRKWKTLNHTEYIKPLKAPDIKISATVLACEPDAEYVQDFLENVEPWFDEFVFIIDKDDSTDTDIYQEINRYSEKQESLQPTNFDRNKFIIKERLLNNDFASQTNFAIENCSNDWVMKLDLDERFPEQMLSNLRFIIQETLEKNPNVSVIGFPRLNLLDGKVSNDIPREHWFTEEFNKHPERPQGVNNPDIQYRLHKKEEKWIGAVHEVPESVFKKDGDRISVIEGLFIHHPKDRQRQFNQEKKYAEIAKKNPPKFDKFVFDSVIYTVEGISQHAREEIKELDKRGNKVVLLDQNYKQEFGEEFKKFYDPIDFGKDNYVTIVNQPPVRWNNSKGLKNRIGYLAFEGKLSNKWTQLINESDIIELWTPSTYCKQMFLESGVKKPIVVIPHGIDPDVWKPLKVEQFEQFTFLCVGTSHNQRKGLDLAIKAFSEEFSKDEDVRLLLKVNRIYNPHEKTNDLLHRYVNWEGNTNIEYYDENLSEQELVELFNKSHVMVHPSRSEGFGINALNALACGTPLIVSNSTGMTDFCTKENSLLVNVGQERPTRFDEVYENAKWPEPDIDSIKKQMRYAYENYNSLKKKAVKHSSSIRRQWNWKKVVDKMLARIN